jgi:hypothetical protein
VTVAANAKRTALRCGKRAAAMARWIAMPDTGTLRRVCEGLRGWMVKASTVERECGCAGGRAKNLRHATAVSEVLSHWGGRN